MKKFLLLVLTFVMCFAFATSAQAEKVNVLTGEGSSDLLVTLTVGCRFRVVIPERVAFSEDGDDTLVSVRAYDLRLWNGSRLNITVRSANEWELRDAKDHFGYSVIPEGSKAALKNGDQVMSVPNGTTFAQQVLDFTLDEEVMTAGEFTDKLTFVLSIDEA